MNIKLAIIHPKWLIEENAISFRKDVWFKPPKLPKTIENIIMKINIFVLKQYERIIKGAIFCHVIITIFLYQFNPSITLGNQKWKGAVPLFNRSVDAIKGII